MECFNFVGRPDGIGNRLEQLIKLNAYADKNKIKVNYIWKNKHKNRSYDIMLRTTGGLINIATTPQPGVPFLTSRDIILDISREELIQYAGKIIPNFKITFEKNIKPLGVHLRGTDRIKNNKNPNFMKNKREFLAFLWNTIELVNKRKPKYLFVCSDDQKMRNFFIKNLSPAINIVMPVSDENIPLEYIDFFALSQCEEIIMCSRFSSFSALASLIGNLPLTVFYLHPETKNRFKLVCHNTDKIHYSAFFLMKRYYSFIIRNFFNL